MADRAPSKTVLLERRSERELVQEGKSVLEERRDILARMIWEQIVRVEQLEKELQPRMVQARTYCRRTIARHGLAGLSGHKKDEPSGVGEVWRTINRLGIPWLERTVADRERTPNSSPQLPCVSLELDAARRVLPPLIDLLIDLAEAEGNLVRLTHSFRRTQRRVNALEHIILPELEAAIVHTQSALDEVERDDLVRSSLIKRRQTN